MLDSYYDGFVDPIEEARDYEEGARAGDPRRCRRHGCQTSSADVMFDGVCGHCEAEMDDDRGGPEDVDDLLLPWEAPRLPYFTDEPCDEDNLPF